MTRNVVLVCFTAWLIATEYLALELIEFSTGVELIEQAVRRLKGATLPAETLENL